MRYKDFIEDYFAIDEPKTGQLVPFKFRPVQEKYYEMLKEKGIERGIKNPIREVVLKARRQGFSSLALAIFAADDILSIDPTETTVISYRDDATKVFRKRYKNFILSYFKKKGITDERQIFELDNGTELVLRHNKARFYCGTASARVGGRGGVLQKLLFSEAAFYPDKQELRAREIVEGTLRQVDIEAGFVFIESTANGLNNYFAKMWEEAQNKTSRFAPRFFSWKEFYTNEQFELIKSEFTDKRLIPQEYPCTAEEAFLSSGDRFFDPEISSNLRIDLPKNEGNWAYYLDYKPGHRYSLGADISEGVGRHNSTIVVIDFDAKLEIDRRLITKPKVAAVYVNNKIAPDLFAHEIKNGGLRYGNCLVCPERNNHGFATIAILKDIYFNIYKDEHEKLGWQTNSSSKPRIMHELRSAIHEGLIDISDEGLKREIINYPAVDLNSVNVNEEDETGGHYDRIMAFALAWAMRNQAIPSQKLDFGNEKFYNKETFDKYLPISEL